MRHKKGPIHFGVPVNTGGWIIGHDEVIHPDGSRAAKPEGAEPVDGGELLLAPVLDLNLLGELMKHERIKRGLTLVQLKRMGIYAGPVERAAYAPAATVMRLVAFYMLDPKVLLGCMVLPISEADKCKYMPQIKKNKRPDTSREIRPVQPTLHERRRDLNRH